MRLPVAFLLFLALPAAEAKRAPDVLTVNAASGPAPLVVKVSGPNILRQKATECVSTFGSYGFSVDWGDGSSAQPKEGKCLEELEHTYTVPGTYALQASVYHPGPTDAPVYDFQGSLEIKVWKGGKTKALRIELLEPGKPLEVFWGSGLPRLKFRIETAKEVELVGELITGNGVVLASSSKRASFSGEDFLNFTGFGNGPSGELFDREGKLDAYLRLQAREGTKVIAEKKGPRLTLNAKVNFRSFTVKPAEGKAPLEVRIQTQIFHPSCYSYVVDWGDGSPDSARGRPPQPPGSKGCRLQSEPFELSHTYKKKGEYRIRWWDNNANPFELARKAPGYMESRVKVR